MVTLSNTQLNRFWQANLALALAAIPSYLVSTNLPDSITKQFEAWRTSLALTINYDALLGMTIFWWSPALLVFLLMLFTNFERWLKVNILAQLSILVANLFMFLLTGLTVYHNSKVYIYALAHDRDVILLYTLSFAATVTLVNMAWHYLIAPNPKLRAWLLEDIFSPLVK